MNKKEHKRQEHVCFRHVHTESSKPWWIRLDSLCLKLSAFSFMRDRAFFWSTLLNACHYGEGSRQLQFGSNVCSFSFDVFSTQNMIPVFQTAGLHPRLVILWWISGVLILLQAD